MQTFRNLLSLLVFHFCVLEAKGFSIQGLKAFSVRASPVRQSNHVLSSMDPSFASSFDPLNAGSGSPSIDFSGNSITFGSSEPSKGVQELWRNFTPVLVQGNSLRTWSFEQSGVENVQVLLKTNGRPLNAELDLWHGPDYTPSRMKIYIQDGQLRPFHAVFATPMSMNTIAVYNTANMEYPMATAVDAKPPTGVAAYVKNPEGMAIQAGTVQGGGAVRTFPMDPNCERIAISLKSDGRNIKARVELTQGPNNVKQAIEFYSSDGKKRPFFAVVETPGPGNVIRIINENTVEFPFTACLQPEG